MVKGLPAAKRRGRPALPLERVKRYALGIRTTKQIKDLLQHAADSSGRSVAQEIELRLERSFDVEKSFGGHRLAAVFRSLAATAEFLSGGKEWLDDYRTFNTVIDAWRHDLEGLQPQEPVETSHWRTELRSQIENMPPEVARAQLHLAMLNKGLSEEARREFQALLESLPRNS